METLGEASKFIAEHGFSVFVAVVCLSIIASMVVYNHKSMGAMIDSFSKRIEALTGALTILTDKVSAPYLGVADSMIIYHAIMKHTVTQEIKFIGEILYANNIYEEKEMIKDNIRLAFERLSHEAASQLSGFRSKCGDMGKYYLDNTDLEKLLNPINATIFGGENRTHKQIDDHRKIEMIRNMLMAHVAKIGNEIEQNGVNN